MFFLGWLSRMQYCDLLGVYVMTGYQPPEEGSRTPRQRRSRVWGIALIIIGCFLLAVQFVDRKLVELLILPFLGVLFLAWGAVGRRKWLAVPGGVLLGIGAGLIMSREVFWDLGRPATSGVFLVCFACGWFVAYIISSRLGHGRTWWMLIPGVVLAAVGIPLILTRTAPEVVEWIATYWPVLLIALGILLIVRTRAD